VIFITVGSMLPFNRLIETMDAWAARHPQQAVFAQIGDGSYEPRHMDYARMVPGPEFRARIAAAALIVAHAGIGSVFSALEFGKPIVLVPRYADAREHTTDHQLHTANWLRTRPGIVVAERGDDMDAKMEQARHLQADESGFSSAAPAPFIAAVRQLILT